MSLFLGFIIDQLTTTIGKTTFKDIVQSETTL